MNIFYKLEDSDTWINLNYMESLSIHKTNGMFEARANPLDCSQGYYVLESFDDREEAVKCVEYLLSETKGD